MKIVSVEVENHPVLGNFLFNFDGGADLKVFNLLIGSNGAGKTQVMDLIYDCLSKGFSPWNDNIRRKLTVAFTEEEMEELGIEYSDVRFEYSGETPGNWQSIGVYNASNNSDVTTDLTQVIRNETLKNIFKKSCRYSPVEINFSNRKIDSVKATTIDEDDVKMKSGPDLATEIGQLLVDIYNQDAQDALERERSNDGKGVEYKIHSGKYDRFRSAYSKMFEGKELGIVTPKDKNHNILFKDIDSNTEFGIEGLSSGEKQVVYRAGYLLSNLGNINGGIIFIDEPELSLHPIWQQKYLGFLEEIFTVEGDCNIQFFIATHSPYIIKGSDFSKTCIWQMKRDNGVISSENIQERWSILPQGPTLGEITYQVFGLPTTDFHCDLYGAIQSQNLLSEIKDVEAWFLTKGQTKEISWTDLGAGNLKEETLMTCIRNKIHHSDNIDRPKFTEQQLEDSINRMLSLI